MSLNFMAKFSMARDDVDGNLTPFFKLDEFLRNPVSQMHMQKRERKYTVWSLPQGDPKVPVRFMRVRFMRVARDDVDGNLTPFFKLDEFLRNPVSQMHMQKRERKYTVWSLPQGDPKVPVRFMVPGNEGPRSLSTWRGIVVLITLNCSGIGLLVFWHCWI